MNSSWFMCVFLLSFWSALYVLGYILLLRNDPTVPPLPSKRMENDSLRTHTPITSQTTITSQTSKALHTTTASHTTTTSHTTKALHTTKPATKYPNSTFLARPWNCSNCFQWNYKVLLTQKDVCRVRGKSSIDLVFLIPSTHTKRAARDAIRKTWASITHNNTSSFRCVFFFGVTKDAKLMRQVEKESRHFRDVVVFNFTDTYRNLTLKTVMMLRWLTEQCANARFFLKIDDDMWVNTNILMDKLTQVEDSMHRAIAGHCTMSPFVIRSAKHKWGVSFAEYPAKRYPVYCSGTAYAGTVHVATRIVSVSRSIPFFSMEDVYIGLCLRQLGYGVRLIDGFHMSSPRIVGWDACSARKPPIVTLHKVPPEALYKFWNATCKKPEKHPSANKKHV